MALFQHYFRSIRDLIPNSYSGFKSLVISILVGLLMFLLGLSASFPEEVLRARLQYELQRNLPADITISHATLRLPYSFVAEDIKVRPDQPTVPELNFDSIKITPHLTSLLGKPGACFEATIGKGQISGSFSQNGELTLTIDTLAFDEPLQGFSQIRLSGQIKTARLDSHMQPDPDKPSTMKLLATQLKLSGTRNIGLPQDQLNLGQLNIIVDGTGRNFTIKQAVLSGGDIQASATGKITVGKTIASTRLNTELQVKPAASLDTSVSSLFELFGSPGSAGGRKINIRGTLARPVVR